MLTLKRLLVIVATLLCALSIAACSGPSNANAQGTANSSNSGVSTTNEIAKETTQSQSQASKQTANKQTTSQASTTQSAQVPTSVNNSQQTSGQTTVTQTTQTTQSSQQADNSQNNNEQNNDNQTANNKHQTSTNVNDATNDDNSSNNNNSSNSNNSSGTNTMIRVSQVSINGQMTNVLANGNGMTLYYDTNDTSTHSTCTGNCTQTWHPFLAQGQIIMTNSVTSGQITTQSTANGKQVEYNGHPLYTYANDTSAGQVNGQGVNNVWNAAAMVTVQAAHW